MISRLFFILRKCKVFKNAKPFCCCCLVAQTSLTFATPWTVAHQAPLSMGFSRQEYWSGLPFSSPGAKPFTTVTTFYSFFVFSYWPWFNNGLPQTE